MEWIYDGKAATEELMVGNMGFVYEITNLTTGKKYIGKKSEFSVYK